MLRILLTCIWPAIVGTFPGIVVGLIWDLRPGAGVAGIGALVGFLMGLRRMSVRRAAALTLGFMASRFTGPIGDRVLDDLDGETESNELEGMDVEFAVLDWLLLHGIRPRRGWAVLVGAGLGLVWAVWQDMTSHSTEPDHLLHARSMIWGAASAGVVASTAYRRPVIVATILSAYVGFCLDIAENVGPYRLSGNQIDLCTLSAVGFTLLVTAICGGGEDEQHARDAP